jgi:membrane protein involved in colicin uptake
MVSKAMQVVYGSVTAVIQSLGSLGSSVVKFIKGDFSGAWKDAKSSVTDFGKNYDESIKRFQDGSKELTKTEKEEAEKRKKAKEEADKIAKQKKEEERLAELARLDARLNAVRTYEANIAAEEIDAENERKKRAAEKQAQIEQENNAELNSIATYEANITAISNEEAEKRKKVADIEARAKNASLQLYAQGLGQIADAIGSHTEAGKVAAIASVTISTYLAAQNAYAGQMEIVTPDAPFRAALAASLAVAAGLANVNAIINTQTPDGGTSGGMAPQPAAPRFNVVGASTANQVAQAVGGNIPPVRAYVVANDVTSQQALDRNRVSAATLG